MKRYEKIVYKSQNDFCQLLCALYNYSESAHRRFWTLQGIFIFVHIAQSCVMCFIAVVQQHM